MRAEIAGEHCKCDHCVQHGDSAHTYTENCVSTVYEGIVREKAAKCLILLEAGTGIEPVYTDLQRNAYLQSIVFNANNYVKLRLCMKVRKSVL